MSEVIKSARVAIGMRLIERKLNGFDLVDRIEVVRRTMEMKVLDPSSGSQWVSPWDESQMETLKDKMFDLVHALNAKDCRVIDRQLVGV